MTTLQQCQKKLKFAGHFVAPFIVHAYCNFMGFPDFGEVCTGSVLLLVFFLFSYPSLTIFYLCLCCGDLMVLTHYVSLLR